MYTVFWPEIVSCVYIPPRHFTRGPVDFSLTMWSTMAQNDGTKNVHPTKNAHPPPRTVYPALSSQSTLFGELRSSLTKPG